LKKNSQGARRHTVNAEYFKNITTPQQAYWLGFIMADGCVYHGSDKNSYRLQINLSAVDAEHLSKFNKAIESDYAIIRKAIHNKKTGKDYEVVQLKINCTQMCKDLIALNVTPKKSLTCEFPDLDQSLLPHYLRGYFDGDGCITESKGKWHISIVGGEPMLRSLQDYLVDNDISSAIYQINHSKAVSLEISNLKSISRFYKLIYEEADVLLERKYEKFAAFNLSRHTGMCGQ